MRRIILTAFLAATSLLSFAQKWQPGYFIDSKDNRMDGLIQPYPGGKAPVKGQAFIVYKQNKDANEMKLSAGELKYFVAGKDSFVVTHPAMGEVWPNEFDFVRVVLNEELKLYVYRGTIKGGSPVQISPGLGLGAGTGGSYVGGGLGISFGGGGAKHVITYYYGNNTAELRELSPLNFEDIMAEIMGDEPDVVDRIKSHMYNLGNIDKLIAYFKQVQASHQ
ncbi:hypothetical protein [Mucilaginibacter polytrichastri]|uniref:DUF4468 domain-containing protein n=1 Tax=Mucilaginibacter polytrichastri TaxID=1302689 RepID=A0A1Q5ZZE5_9SPHI|nr:hypothetical protein [Mucilaginibacter polytrichastri]OKS87112.1 hypothetical protein RG47T_2571 [Mucilaginibacter polytrichastri]SFS87642.1 hypothetical protein SAMN04487890_105181 [Mucilaginibacter polytrichastri]